MTSTADAAENTPEEFFGAGFGYKNKVLTIPSKTLTQTTPQFDFMFSNVYERDLNTNPDYVTPVALEFSHLFTAFRITAENVTDNEYSINSISITGLKNQQYAQIKYDTDQNSVQVDYFKPDDETGENIDNIFTFNFDTPISLVKGNEPQCLTSSDNNDNGYILMWPHESAIGDCDEVIVKLNYTFNDTSKENSSASEEEAEFKLLYIDNTYVSLSPGFKYTFNINFNIKQITFRIEQIISWNDEEKNIYVDAM